MNLKKQEKLEKSNFLPNINFVSEERTEIFPLIMHIKEKKTGQKFKLYNLSHLLTEQSDL